MTLPLQVINDSCLFNDKEHFFIDKEVFFMVVVFDILLLSHDCVPLRFSPHHTCIVRQSNYSVSTYCITRLVKITNAINSFSSDLTHFS